MRLLPAILIAVAVVLAPAIWVGLTYFLSEEDFQGSAVDSGARIEIEMLRQQVEDLQDRLKSMESELAQVAAGRGRTAMVPTNPDDEDAIFRNSGPNDIIDAYAQVVLIANRTEVNRGLQVARPSYLEEKLGRPRETLSDDCEPMTNQTLSSKLVLEDVGPIRVNMRNAMIPVVTVVGLYLGILIGNSVLTEIVFNRPGLGKLIIGALNQRDYTMLQGMMVIYTLIVVLVNLLTDLTYGLIDPRIKY